jgi:hypothetical protein
MGKHRKIQEDWTSSEPWYKWVQRWVAVEWWKVEKGNGGRPPGPLELRVSLKRGRHQDTFDVVPVFLYPAQVYHPDA